MADIWRHSCRLSSGAVGLSLSPMHVQVRSEGLFGGLRRLFGASLSGALAAGKDIKSLRAFPCRYRVALLQDSVGSFH